ncbi:acyltransferase family protein [Nocardioides sp.]|uniref:acyltransferase family protein n=1 Tax=Nocardioides sp. TaxID=35761 RepID=UPI002B596A78|nr:acyltransferase family protein [Nocardioides sp.]HSX67585.1 acyltransferase family protein [Nocardioides sp.]
MTAHRTEHRTDIQALRAAAVTAVVLFHVWPGAVRGGYVGVDVFFVISGFLITGHLLGELREHGRIRLVTFWGRRLRRLMPAALTVLTATAAAVWLLLPTGERVVQLREVVASALYVENWLLAHDSVDYLAAENSPSSVQHYWSLAVEEQFYVVWPLLLLLAGRLAGFAARRGVRRGAGWWATVVLAGVLAASLVASVVLTARDPGPAYFATWTRAWEFAAGGLLAAWAASSGTGRLPAPVASAARTLGWAAIAGTALLYTPDTAFPGWAALAPVLGAVLVIAAGDAAPGSRYRTLTGARLVSGLGTLSYGIYLWHWPLIVVGGAVTTWFVGVPVLLATVLLAWVTFHGVENPVRFHQPLVRSSRWTYLAAATAISVVVAGSLVGIRAQDHAAAASARQAQRLLDDATACLGARAVLGDRGACPNPRLDGVLVPDPTARLRDTGGAYACYSDADTSAVPIRSCHYGSRRPDAVRVALVGNSHATALLPGLRPALKRLNWSLDTYVGRNCRWIVSELDADRCAADRPWLEPLTTGTPYDVILVTNRRELSRPAGQPNPAAAAMAAAWQPAIARGTTVVAIADNPGLPPEVEGCLAAGEDLADLAACRFSPTQAWATDDPLRGAAALAGAELVDLTGAFCADDRCPLVIGNVLVYRDSHHLTATFVRTLAPYLLAQIRAAIDREQK